MPRHIKPPVEAIRVIITPESKRKSVRLSEEAHGIAEQLSDLYRKRLGHRVSANNVIHLALEAMLNNELEVQ